MLQNAVGKIVKSKKSTIVTQGEGSHKAFVTSQIFNTGKTGMVAVLPNAKKAKAFFDELSFFMPEQKQQILFFPGYNILPFKSLSYHKETSSRRLAVLARIINNRADKLFIVTYIEPLLQKMIPVSELNQFAELVINNEEIDRDQLILKLEAGGYTRTSLVEDPGEYAVRGGILDVFSPGESKPVRIEFFGDLVESLRSFSPISQRRSAELSETIIIPATEAIVTNDEMPHVLARLRDAGNKAGLEADQIREYVNEVREFGRFQGLESMLSIVYQDLDSFFKYIPEHFLFLMDAPDELEEKADDFEKAAILNYKNAISENRLCVKDSSLYLCFESVHNTIINRPHITFQSLVTQSLKAEQSTDIFHFKYEDNLGLSGNIKAEITKDNPLKPLVTWYEEKIEQQYCVVTVLSQDSQAKRLVSLLSPYGIEPVPVLDFNSAVKQGAGIYYLIGDVYSGFVSPETRLALVVENEIFGKKRIRRRSTSRRQLKSQMIAPEELKNGDIVVHLEHGLGRYDGLTTLKVDRISQDFILLVYQDDDKLYLPVDRIEMIGKYIGVDGYSPVLDKIGGKAWIKSKAKAKEEVEKLAAELLDLYAMRRVNKGISYSPADHYFREFETSFPYDETRDQLKAIDDVLADMEAQIPMDRLVCGDVGYGKTEVAIRASFKAVNDGKQVAIVVPTTILAEQHLATFKERFEKYPVNIECLSRFRTKKEQTGILKKMNSGLVDITIGTHRLLQKDVSFSALGLLIIDEEQRFGVKHKEALKKKRSIVDVLALTATPIPRTLHLSLTGMRDISVIATPPADRQPIISYISKYEDAIVADAVKKELARKGQIFFVHNNIKTIDKMAENLSQLAPKARIGVAHGRLSESELERIMLDFVNFKIDILVCTTIVESGLDIPSANTMIINKAERFGLSQIYQLRGRIGRGDHQAYAYLFISDEKGLTKDARKRLSALMEHRDLGSGFQIAMKDLQIRGAGTALGASQSGHIAAVGYDMFLKLLDMAVNDLKGDVKLAPLDPEINAAMSSGFAEDYIESVEQRLTLYRRLSRMSEVSDIKEIKNELVDRYGKLPKEAENMLLKIMLRIFCIKAGVKKLDIGPNVLILSFSMAHLNQSLDAISRRLPNHEFVKKDSLKIRLGHKRIHISKTLLETKNILKSIAAL
ncbi:MAG: transcription-repair coupling factor [Desulfobacteraceae bacterium]|nr:transcription-repair coupling factor [Desulfobacteraceae bacterium]